MTTMRLRPPLRALARLLVPAMLAGLPLAAAAAPGGARAARVHAEAVDIVIGYRICARAYDGFAAHAAQPWADFRKHYPLVDAEVSHGIERIDDSLPPTSDEEEQERLSTCVDMLLPGGFDPTRAPDPRLATPAGALALLDQAVRAGDRALALRCLTGDARHRVAAVFDADEDTRRVLADTVRADRVGAGTTPTPDDPYGIVVHGRGAAATLTIKKIRDEWRVAHL